MKIQMLPTQNISILVEKQYACVISILHTLFKIIFTVCPVHLTVLNLADLKKM